MKVIKKTLVAGILACSALNAQAEVEAISYGIKAAYSASFVSPNDDAKFKGGSTMDARLFGNQFFAGSLYFEYAFNDYIGLGLEAGYMRQGGVLTAKEAAATTTPATPAGQETTTTPATDKSSITMTTHGVLVPLSLYVYPLGREEGAGILKVFTGMSFYLPVGEPTFVEKGTDDKDLEKTALTDAQKTAQKSEFPGIDIGVHGGMAYEFPIGLSIEAKWGYGFMNRLGKVTTAAPAADGSTAAKGQTIFTAVDGLKDLNSHYFNVGIGYNLATLFCD